MTESIFATEHGGISISMTIKVVKNKKIHTDHNKEQSTKRKRKSYFIGYSVETCSTDYCMKVC